MEPEIIDCGGKYEVHPKLHGGWAVVNGETGQVRCEFGYRRDAVAEATKLNKKLAESNEE